jgi:hypothetical protein
MGGGGYSVSMSNPAKRFALGFSHMNEKIIILHPFL